MNTKQTPTITHDLKNEAVTIEGPEVDDPEIDYEGQDNELRFHFTHEGVIVDLIGSEGQVRRSFCNTYEEFIDSMRQQ
jgi:hypothetical protein